MTNHPTIEKTQLSLVPFTEQNAELLIQWIDSAELNCLWGGASFDYPLTHQQVVDHCLRADVFPFLLVQHSLAMGYVELFRVSARHYRICRVLIADEFRGQGMATIMLELLMDKARTEMKCKQLSLSVFEHNLAARRCYEGLGFKAEVTEKGQCLFEDQQWTLIYMERHC